MSNVSKNFLFLSVSITKQVLPSLVIFIFNQKKLMRYVNMRYANMNINIYYIYNCGIDIYFDIIQLSYIQPI